MSHHIGSRCRSFSYWISLPNNTGLQHCHIHNNLMILETDYVFTSTSSKPKPTKEAFFLPCALITHFYGFRTPLRKDYFVQRISYFALRSIVYSVFYFITYLLFYIIEKVSSDLLVDWCELASTQMLYSNEVVTLCTLWWKSKVGTSTTTERLQLYSTTSNIQQ